MRKNKLLIGFFLSLAVLIAFEFYIYLNYSTISKDITHISFVMTGDNLDLWENMQSGAETAALDMDCDVNFVNCSMASGVDGEIEAIKRQLKEGADYVVCASSFEDQLQDFLSENSLGDKVSLIEAVEDNSLGQDFADYIVEKGSKNVLILSGKENETLLASLDKAGVSYRTMAFDGYDFENNVLSESLDVYCIDNRPEAVYYLDKEMISALAYRDDFSLGYITVKHLLTEKSLNRIARGATLYYIVDKDSMYSEKMEKILFPFAK